MSDQQPTIAPTPPAEKLTAGQMLRQARQARGLHIAALATSIKVLPKKLEALEADRYDELPDATFTRALAQTVCRSLKIDPAPVLALLPRNSGMQLERAESSLNAPFRHRQGHPGRSNDSKSWGERLPLRLWLPLLLVLGAVALYFSPDDFHPWRAMRAVFSNEAAPAGDAAASESSGLPAEPAASATDALQPVQPPGAPAAEALASPAVGAASASAALLELRVSKDSWIEVQDGASKPLLMRLVNAQEVVALNGSLPLRLKVGNASSTTVRFRGQLVDLVPVTRDNVARLELK